MSPEHPGSSHVVVTSTAARTMLRAMTQASHKLRPIMKTIGLLGGEIWESTAIYYRKINEGVKKRLGGFHSAEIVMVSVDIHEIEVLQMEGKWDEAGEFLGQAARQLENVGADVLLICTSTMHKVAEIVESKISIPILHIADATAQRICSQEPKAPTKIGLLGTKFTMEQVFYRGRLEQHGLKVFAPPPQDRQIVNSFVWEISRMLQARLFCGSSMIWAKKWGRSGNRGVHRDLHFGQTGTHTYSSVRYNHHSCGGRCRLRPCGRISKTNHCLP